MLSDNQILELIRRGCIRGVDIPPNPYTAESPVQPGSLDLHVAGVYLPGASADEAGGEHHPLTEYLLKTGETVLVSTAEDLELPRNIGGFAFPPSRFAVRALLVTNGGHIDPEYSGPLRFTVINMGHQVQSLTKGQRVGTLVLFATDEPVTSGWSTRTGKSGRTPNTEDLLYLCTDFADVTKRANEIAKSEIDKARLQIETIEQRWNRRAWFAAIVMGFAVTLAVAVFGWYSPVAKLEMQVASMREEFVGAKATEDRLRQLEAKPDPQALSARLDLLEKRTTSLEKRLK